jgi:hypothetical protein
VARIPNCAARRLASLYPLHHPVSTILTCLQRVDEAQLKMKGWQDHGCQRKAKLLAGHAELVRGWMTSKMHFRPGEGMVEAYCAMRMMEAQVHARERLDIESRVRWHPHHERTRSHWEEGTVAGCQQRRPGSGVARDRKAATWDLNHFHAMAAGRRDGAATGAVRAMGVSRGRCFLRAR